MRNWLRKLRRKCLGFVRRGARVTGNVGIEIPITRLVAEPWQIDEICPLENGSIQIRGWALPLPDVAQDQQYRRCTVNGAPPLTVAYPLHRPDVQEVIWRRPGADWSGYVLTAAPKFPNGVMQVTFSDPENSPTQRGRESWFLPDPAVHQTLPSESQRFRVIGNKDPFGFLSIGCTDAHRLIAAYENVRRNPWSEVGRVLDWGVGCGRIARHIAPSMPDRFHGCDIDRDNVSWCAANLPGSYAPSTLQPPLPYADSMFDVIYGVSVFTHLRAHWEAKWLEELHRVLRPGGVIMMTVHGTTAADFANLPPGDYDALLKRVESEGLAVTSDNDQLVGFVESPAEYVNVFHSHDHIRNVWGRWFNVLEVLPGYIFTHDLVVAEKRVPSN